MDAVRPRRRGVAYPIGKFCTRASRSARRECMCAVPTRYSRTHAYRRVCFGRGTHRLAESSRGRFGSCNCNRTRDVDAGRAIKTYYIGSGWLSDWIKQSRLLSGVEAAQLPLFRETEKRVAVFWMESIECGGGCLRTKTKKNIKEPGRGCSWSVAGGGPCHGTTRDLFTSGQGNLSRLTTCLHQAKFEIVSEKHARTYSLTTTAASAWALGRCRDRKHRSRGQVEPRTLLNALKKENREIGNGELWHSATRLN